MKTRKLPITITLVTIITSCISSQAFAARSENQQAALEGGTISTAAITGAAAGGPLGFIVGSLVGIFFAEQTRQGNNAELALAKNQHTLNELNQTIVALNTEISDREFAIASLEQKAIDRLALQVLFNTGDTSLSDQELARVEVLAEQLRKNEDLAISLTGHTDPRGSDEYNNLLAMERVKAVQQALITFGIDPDRIITNAHGAEFSKASPGQYDQYARDRRVDIDITNGQNNPSVAVIEDIKQP
jgi:outer membrane protein OmpA-like peptidoglycan-associated protein